MELAGGTASEAARRLRRESTGTVIGQLDNGYDEARRVWNGMIDRRPAAVVQAGGVADVAPVLRVARELGLPLAIRGGGHNVAGNGTVDGGIVLDLSGLTDVEVDAESRLVRVAPGATLAHVDRATEPFALAVPIGVVSATGVAGLTLGGGVGWLTRAHGLTIDNLVSVTVVTADGTTAQASEAENPELFWGVRGGGGNFGIASSFTYRAYPLGPSVFAGNFIYRRQRWGAALEAWAAWTADMPDDMTSIITFVVPPPDWQLGDEALMLVGFAWAGADHAQAEAVSAPLRSAAPPDTEVLEPTGWVAWQSQADGLFPKGSRAYWKNAAFDRLDTAMIRAIVEHAGVLTWHGTAADIHHMGGAFGRVDEDTTPFPNRGAGYWLNIYGFWAAAADDAARTAWVRGFHAAMAPHARAGEYVNFLGHDAEDAKSLATRAYGEAKFARLAAVKRRYDPENIFRLNHNIPPD